MTYRAILLITTVSGALFGSCAKKDNPGDPALSAERLERRIIELSSDEFKGRKPFTEGEKRTLEYLQEQFAAAGLEPGNGNSYLQEVPMVEITTTAEPTMRLRTAYQAFELKGHGEYVVWSRIPTGTSLDNTELVFAGYGIVAPEYNWNDYEGLDVKDKVVLVMVNDPGFGSNDTTFFKGSTMTYYGRWTYKFEEAARRGAKGCLVIHEDAAASYPFGVLQNSWNTAKLYLESGQSVCPVEGWISFPATRKLFESVGLNLSEELAAARKPGYKGRSLGIRATTALPAVAQKNNSYNVIGKITGTTRPEETIIYTAHWDHLGIGMPDASGDSIYNGALDNASGTAGILEIAEAFHALDPKPERTVVFLAVTAEEEGLLGSAWYVNNPIYPPENTVANINIDVLNSFGPMKNVVIVGYGQSDLDDYVKALCRETGRYVSPDPHPEAGFYFRSDHFNFAKAGIPALYLDPGNDHVTGGIEYGEKMSADYTAHRYHQPADEYDPTTWRLDGALEDLQLLFEVGRRLAFESSWPQWKEGSEFKAIREASRANQ
jgi:Zn-dependent M28 family amino/carboxypeptidase